MKEVKFSEFTKINKYLFGDLFDYIHLWKYEGLIIVKNDAYLIHFTPNTHRRLYTEKVKIIY